LERLVAVGIAQISQQGPVSAALLVKIWMERLYISDGGDERADIIYLADK
jgi:hypothetical protein